MFNPELQKHVKHNSTVNIMDGAFFGFGLGFASSVTVVPLFVDTLTDSTILIGLIASIQMVGWQLPQILTANRVANLRRYVPMVLAMTFHERWPFFALAAVALALPLLGTTAALVLTFIFLSWQALGGGFTATAWQAMIGKIIPLHRRGTFWGMQAAAASITTAVGAYGAGYILVEMDYPGNFALVFFLAAVAMMLSWAFLAWTREPETDILPAADGSTPGHRRLRLRDMIGLVRADSNLRAFLVARFLAQFGWMAVAFFTIYGVRRFGMDEATAGLMLALLTIVQTVANPFMGWLGDLLGHRRVFAVGALALAMSAFAAMFAPTLGWLYLAFALAGIGHTAIWTVSMTMTLEFGAEADRPYYIGLANTLIAPATLIAPLAGGWLADTAGFGATFTLALMASMTTAFVLLWVVREPRVHYAAKMAVVGASQQIKS